MPDEYLNKAVIVDTNNYSMSIIADFTDEEIYINRYDSDDYHNEESFKEECESGNIDEGDYFIQPKGHPFLTTEF